MFVKSIEIAQKTMFPIFRWEQIDANNTQIGVAGTGFFINSEGYFVSVAHIFSNINVNTKFVYLGLLPDEVQNPGLNIEEIYRNNELDIFVGRVDIKTPQYFHLSKSIPNIGRSVCVSGYPLAEIRVNSQGGPELGGVRRYFQPTFVLDKVISDTNSGDGIKRRHDGFLARDVGLFGMSGGPVFDLDGVVVGMQAAVTSPRESSNGLRTIIVENAIVIRSNLILDSLTKCKVQVDSNA